MTRKNKKSIWIDKKIHGWFKQRALDQSKLLDKNISMEEIIREALEKYIEVKNNELVK